MTVYSQHASRGKIQILATYQGASGVVSSTVTSVTDSALAEPIVDALNRISALATVPLGTYDRRKDRFRRYPSAHLAALTDRDARIDLLNGAHSLWYEQVKLLLHQALVDLDDAVSAVPPPVRMAIETELETEARELRAALAEYEEGLERPESPDTRYWGSSFPFVTFGGGMHELSNEVREGLDRQEEGLTAEQREEMVADLRLLVTAYAQYRHGMAHLEISELSIFDEPEDSDGYYLAVDAPKPNMRSMESWRIEIGRWEPDDPEDEDCGSATGKTILTCDCAKPPAASEIAGLLNRNADRPGQLRLWADTSVGSPLSGTNFIVTKRYAPIS